MAYSYGYGVGYGGSGYGLTYRDPLRGWGDDITDWQNSGSGSSGFGDVILEIVNGPTAGAIVEGIFGTSPRSRTGDMDEDTTNNSGDGQQQSGGMGRAILYGIAGLTGLLVLVQIFDALDS